MAKDSKYHVGDKVLIVSSGLDPEKMNKFAGTKQEVMRVKWCNICGRYEYRIKNSSHIWCDDDFEFDAQTELPEFNASELSLKDLFN